jgi:predicted MFS family arabinose efflux permease
MGTYRDLFRTPEFTPLFAATAVTGAATTVAGLALATLVYSATGSPFLSAIALFGSSFAQMIGVATVLSGADRLPPRAALVTIAVLFAAGTAALAIPGLPIWGMVPIILGIGLVNSVAGGVRWGLLGEILPDGQYLPGRSVFAMTSGIMQILGFALGGTLTVLLAPRETLLVGAGLYVVAALVARWGLTARPPRASGRPSIRQTWRVNAHLFAEPARRATYIAMWVPNGLIVGCEALFVPYAPHSASVLFMATAFGMLIGDLVAGRFVPVHRRQRLITAFQTLLAVPFLVFALPIARPVAIVAGAVGAVGYGASLLLQDRLLAQTGADVRGQALGLHSAGLLALQAVGATIAGGVAQVLPVGPSMAVMALGSLAVTAALAPAMRRPTAALAGTPELAAIQEG